MKKAVIFIVVVVAILGSIWYIINQRKMQNNITQSENQNYEKMYNIEITGTELISTINKMIDSNEKNAVNMNDKGIYESNNENSISLEIKFIDNEDKIKAEKIYENGVQKFLELYSDTKFILKNIEYHEKTKKVKYLYFEEQE